MRVIAALTLMAISLHIPSSGQTAQKTSTFTNSDGAFRFVYPTDFQVCTRGKIDACNQSFIPVCERDALVCVVHPAEGFKDTSFEAASFQVREILTEQEMMTADGVCDTLSTERRRHGLTLARVSDLRRALGRDDWRCRVCTRSERGSCHWSLVWHRPISYVSQAKMFRVER